MSPRISARVPPGATGHQSEAEASNGAAPPTSISAGIAALWIPDAVRELRVLGTQKHGTVTGYFDDPVACALAAATWDGDGAVCLTLGGVDPRLLHRAPNQWRDWTPKGEAAGDADVCRRLWLGVDIDPATPRGIPASDAEHLATVAARDQIAAWLEGECGWPAGLRGRSGNGANGLYRLDLENTPEMTALVRGVLRTLKDRFTTSGVKIDESVADAAQLWRVYGTTNIKGVASPERPHRLAQIDTCPATWAVVTAEQLAAVAALASTGSKRRARPGATGATPLLEAVRARGWYLEDLGGGKHSMICPWESGHSVESPPSATCFFEPSDAHPRGGFRCLHNSCTARHLADLCAALDVPAPSDPEAPVTLEDFYGYALGGFLYVPTRDLWPASTVNARLRPLPVGTDSDGDPITIRASVWLASHRPIEQMTWSPGDPDLIHDRLMDEGGWIPRAGARVFNLYRPPTLVHGDPDAAGPWLDHVRRLYPEEAAHIIQWLAHRVQRPFEKINHAILLGGAPGIGKDTLIEPVLRAVGAWNVGEASPTTLMGRFNGFLKTVILRVSEARDAGETSRYALADHLKAILASPPDTLAIDEKNVKAYRIPNVVGVLFTTNHRDALYVTEDDRRYFVGWSDATAADFALDYWTGLYRWYDTGGAGHVAAYLAQLDLTGFDPKRPPPKTPAFWALVSAGRAPEADDLADVLAQMDTPPAIPLDTIALRAAQLGLDLAAWLGERRNRRIIPHRMAECGYVAVPNPDDRRGRWMVFVPLAGRLQQVQRTMYARQTLTKHDQYAAVRTYIEQARVVRGQ